MKFRSSLLLMIVLVLGLAGSTKASFEQSWINARNLSLKGSRSELFIESLPKSLFEFERSFNTLTLLERNAYAFRGLLGQHFFEVSFDSIGDQDLGPDLSYKEQTLALTSVLNGRIGLSYGGSLKFYNLKTIEEGHGFSVGLGIQKEFKKGKLALEAENLLNNISYTTGKVESKPVGFNALVTSRIFSDSEVHLKKAVGGDYSLGIEYFPSPQIGFRFGLNGRDWAGGFEITQERLKIIYGLSASPLGLDHAISFGYFL